MTNTDKEVKLENCPMCQGESFIEQVGNDYTSSRGYDYGCKKCRITIKARAKRLSLEVLMRQVAENWNTRAPTAREKELEAGVERLQGLVDHLDKSNDKFIGHARDLQDVIDNIIKVASGKK